MGIMEFIILFTFTLSVFMAAGLLVRPMHYRNVVFSLLVLCLGFLHLFIFLIHSRYIYEYPHFFLLQHPVILSSGPLVYFYILSLTGEKTAFRAWDLVHFSGVPALVVLFSPYLFTTSEEKRELVKSVLAGPFHVVRLAAVAVIAVVMVYGAVSSYKFLKNLNLLNRGQQKICFAAVLLMGWLVLGAAGFIIAVSMDAWMMLYYNIMTGMIITCLFFLDQRYPYLLQFATVPLKRKPYKKSHLDRVDLEDLDRQLEVLMREEKLYCDEDLSLSRLSGVLEITPHQLSQFLNEHHNKSFSSFINEYRLAEAKRLISGEATGSILSIAFAVGFNSYSAFHRAFKKETGQSPADFRQKSLVK
ncbi:MAG: helix-turn-helix domain-containing protein [Spirochaetes bacterium]|nr:helix-turn-helix domain-containing protein [Spirochaetota bacterium]